MSDEKILIEMWSMEEAASGLIVPAPSGFEYSNQVGGTMCVHPKLEGIFIPCPLRCVTDPLRDYHSRTVDSVCGSPFAERVRLTEAWLELNGLLKIFETLTEEEYVTLGQPLAEAWVPLKVRRDLDVGHIEWHFSSWISTFVGRIVVFTYHNSD